MKTLIKVPQKFNWKKDLKLKEYVLRLIARVLLFLVVGWAYLYQPHYFDYIWTKTQQLQMEVQGFELSELREIWETQYSVIWIYAVWALFMISMVVQMFGYGSKLTMGARKVFYDNYTPVESYDRLKMFSHMQEQDLGALKTLLAWSFLNAIIGVLYVFDVIAIKELVLVVAFYYVCDLVCVVIWCPFQRFFMKNRCCVNCRIFNWGYFMIFTPFVFIRNFFTWSLFFMAILLVIRWEYTLVVHPERFWMGSNEVLKCENCKDKMCKIKGKLIFDEQGDPVKIIVK